MQSVKQVPCPRCGSLAPFAKDRNPWRPFCSERCKLIDLGAWSSEQYRVATDEDPETPDDPASSKPPGS